MNQPVLRALPETDPREVILACARDAFAQKGFDGASMQDLARVAGMSAGNFYRYFPSKAAIVEALIARELAQIDAGFARIQSAADPMAAIQAMVRERISLDNSKDCALWAEIVAAAHRRPEIAAAILGMEEAVMGHMARTIGLLRGIPQEEAHARFGTRAQLLLLLVRGIEMQSSLCPSQSPALTELAISEITRILSEMLSEA